MNTTLWSSETVKPVESITVNIDNQYFVKFHSLFFLSLEVFYFFLMRCKLLVSKVFDRLSPIIVEAFFFFKNINTPFGTCKYETLCIYCF